jgi:hypothetical protein
MNPVPISNDPQYPLVERKVWLGGISIGVNNNYGQQVVLTCDVHYYQGGEEITLIPVYSVPLIADNSTCVDANGVIVPCGGEDAVMTEYEYYIQMLAVPIIINDMVEQKILWADSQGRFNQQ